MMHLCGISKYSRSDNRQLVAVFQNLSATIHTDRHTALLGDNQHELSLLLSILAGWELPDSGHVVTGEARLSPIINAGAHSGALLARKQSGQDNIRFIARAYGADEETLSALVRQRCGGGIDLDQPVGKLDRPTMQAFELALAAALPHNCYLVDRMQDLVPQQRRRMSSLARARESGMIFTTTNARLAAIFADNVAIVRDQSIRVFEHLRDEDAFHE